MAEADHERYQQTTEPHGRKKSGNLCGDGKPGERNDRAQTVWLDNENQRKRQMKTPQEEAPAADPAGGRAARRTRQRSPFRLSQAAETAMRVRPPGRAESGRKIQELIETAELCAARSTGRNPFPISHRTQSSPIRGPATEKALKAPGF